MGSSTVMEKELVELFEMARKAPNEAITDEAEEQRCLNAFICVVPEQWVFLFLLRDWREESIRVSSMANSSVDPDGHSNRCSTSC